jgi:hypothetical protein
LFYAEAESQDSELAAEMKVLITKSNLAHQLLKLADYYHDYKLEKSTLSGFLDYVDMQRQDMLISRCTDLLSSFDSTLRHLIIRDSSQLVIDFHLKKLRSTNDKAEQASIINSLVEKVLQFGPAGRSHLNTLLAAGERNPYLDRFIKREMFINMVTSDSSPFRYEMAKPVDFSYMQEAVDRFMKREEKILAELKTLNFYQFVFTNFDSLIWGAGYEYRHPATNHNCIMWSHLFIKAMISNSPYKSAISELRLKMYDTNLSKEDRDLYLIIVGQYYKEIYTLEGLFIKATYGCTLH